MNEVRASDVLAEMLDILDSSDKWCQGASARRTDGESLNLAEVDLGVASSWCLSGANVLAGLRLNASGSVGAAWYLLQAQQDTLHHDPADFNDDPHTTFEDVRLLIKRAFEQAIEDEHDSALV